MLKAYHMIGGDSADFFRLRAGRITEEHMVQTGRLLYHHITEMGTLTPASQNISETSEGRLSRQFHLDRLVGDDHYVFLSLGKRYWNEPMSTNFGFVFDTEHLLRHKEAILRTHDLLSDYENLLDEVVKSFAPTMSFAEEFSPSEVEHLLTALEDPQAEYTSPNEVYYMLIEAIEQQRLEVPLTREATAEFIKRAHILQQGVQCTGEEAIQKAYQQSGTGRFEVLVRSSLSLTHCTHVIYEGREMEGARGYGF